MAVPQKQARRAQAWSAPLLLWLPTAACSGLSIGVAQSAAATRGAADPRQAQEPQRCPGKLCASPDGCPSRGQSLPRPRAKAPKVGATDTAMVQVFLALDPPAQTGRVWSERHGARGGDGANLGGGRRELTAGLWFTIARVFRSPISAGCNQHRLVDPRRCLDPAIAPSFWRSGPWRWYPGWSRQSVRRWLVSRSGGISLQAMERLGGGSEEGPFQSGRGSGMAPGDRWLISTLLTDSQ